MLRALAPHVLGLLLTACASTPAPATAGTEKAPPLEEGQAEAIFAGGCFWCMEKPFDKLDGVISTTSGYTGGEIEGPTYQQVSSHQTKHLEALRVVYDPDEVDYDRLVEVFWHNIDPTQDDGQFCDKGHQYTSAIFYGDKAEKKLAEKTKAEVAEQLGQTVVTDIRPEATFWVAEEYHQDFYTKKPDHYQRYRTGCGRDRRLKQLWGDEAGH